MLKQAIAIRTDIKMSKGKLAAQASHAAVMAALKSRKEKISRWETEGQKKIVLKARSLDELLELRKKAEKLGIQNAVISDAGLTELTPGTITAIAIGPDDEAKIDKVTGSLPLLR